MIFKQVREIIEGKKTQTRRVKKMGEYLQHVDEPYTESAYLPTVYTPIGRIKWQVGRTYAVQPGRGQPQVYYKYVTSYTGEPECLFAHDETTYGGSPLDRAKSRASNWQHELMVNGWKPLSIQLMDIRWELLQDISKEDAIAEGLEYVSTQNGEGGYRHYMKDNQLCNPIYSYRTLWESINGKGSWDDNPEVWVLEFRKVN